EGGLCRLRERRGGECLCCAILCVTARPPPQARPSPRQWRENTMADTVLAASRRTEFGKGAARRTRRDGKIPAVLYGHGNEPVHLSLPGHETFLALKDKPNALLTIALEGENEIAHTKDETRVKIRSTIEQLDFIQ